MKLPNGLSLKPAIISDEYIAKFQIRNNDLKQLYKDDVLVSETYYRIGGITSSKDNHFILLKQVEFIYPEEVIKSSREFAKRNNHKYDGNPNHLNDINVIIDNNGKELFQAEEYESIYLVGEILAICNSMGSSRIINIKTKEVYTNCYSKVLNSKYYLFVDNINSYDKSKESLVKDRCVIQISKRFGNYTIHK